MPDGTRIEAERVVATGPEELFEFLSDLERHWLLAGRFIQVLELERARPQAPARGARVRVRGPFGLSRTAVTRVVEVEPHRRMAGTAQVGPRTLAHVSWALAPEGSGTRVRLAAVVERSSLVDRWVLRLGGAAWMRRGFAKILARLDGLPEP
jgi:uncharacterized protein YndB with AHSA1/START domain